jgi:hypothetical protein
VKLAGASDDRVDLHLSLDQSVSPGRLPVVASSSFLDLQASALVTCVGPRNREQAAIADLADANIGVVS